MNFFCVNLKKILFTCAFTGEVLPFSLKKSLPFSKFILYICRYKILIINVLSTPIHLLKLFIEVVIKNTH